MLTYKESGVDIVKGDDLVDRIRRICPEIGGFSGKFPLGDNYLVAGTDGVGTKLKLAFACDKHDTIGIDLVAMCVNDIVTCGADPLFFLDYFATSQLDVDQAEQVIKGIVQGCKIAECALLGGETAEMPGFYHPGEYDLSGCAVGLVAKKDYIDGSTIAAGDIVLGIPSSGLHSNGFSLVRKILERHAEIPDFLLEPTRIYVPEVKRLKRSVPIKGIAHITGGGLLENVPRIIPEGLGVELNVPAWQLPEAVRWVIAEGDVATEEMFKTFNMGIGMVFVLSPEEVAEARLAIDELIPIGKVDKGKGVQLRW